MKEQGKAVNLKEAIITLGNMSFMKFIKEEFYSTNNGENFEKDSIIKLPLGERRSMIDDLERDVKLIALARMNSIIAGNSNSVSSSAISISLMTVYFSILITMANKLAGFTIVAIALIVYMYLINFKLRNDRKNERVAVFFKTILEDSISREK